MEGRNTALPVQAGLSHSLPPRATNPFPGVPGPAAEDAWKSWDDGMRDAVTVAATSSGARSSAASETFSSNHLRRGRPSTVMGQRRQGGPTRRDDVVVGEDFPTATTMFPPPVFPPPLPPSASYSRGKPHTAATPVEAWQSLQPQPQSRSPVRLDVRRQGRPRPRQAPREGGDSGDDGTLERDNGSCREVEGCAVSDNAQDRWACGVGTDGSTDGVDIDADYLRKGEDRIGAVYL